MPAAQSHNSELDVATSDVDMNQPWLCGFEGSRPDEEESKLQGDYSAMTNAYRHPVRWGQPTIRFEKSHDVYALVCYRLSS